MRRDYYFYFRIKPAPAIKLLFILILINCQKIPDSKPDISAILKNYCGKKPAQWGMNVPGVKTRIKTSEKIMALTFDVCGGECDRALVRTLISGRVPATLFLSGKWLRTHQQEAHELAANSLFLIANHGYEHKPL